MRRVLSTSDVASTVTFTLYALKHNYIATTLGPFLKLPSPVCASMVSQKALQQRITHRKNLSALRAWRKHTTGQREQRAWLQRMSMRSEHDEDEHVVGAAECDRLSTMLDWSVRARIFGMLTVLDLSRCARVCRAWYDMAQDPALWAVVDYAPVHHRYVLW